MAALATKLEGSFPGRVTVQRRRISLLSSRTRVAEISLNTGDAVYAVSMTGGTIRMTRAKLVRDVTLSTATIPPADWLAELRQRVAAMAGSAADSGDALSGLL